MLPFSNYNPSKLVIGVSPYGCNFTAPGDGKFIYSFANAIANQSPRGSASINGRYINAGTVSNFSKGDSVVCSISGYWTSYAAYAYYA